MHVSEHFSKMMRAVIFAFALVVLGFVVSDLYEPHIPVAAQNAGVVGIQAKLTPVFSAQSTSAHSAIFPDIGQGVNILFYCNTNFIGTITLEWEPPSTSTFLQLAAANYVGTGDNACHTITVNGYFPNIRSSVTEVAGSLSAWYSASSGPVGFSAPAIGSFGAASPVACDKAFNFVIPNSGQASVTPTASGEITVICGQTLSFQAAPSTGNVTMAWAANSSCGAIETPLVAYTTAASPQIISIPQSYRPALTSTPVPCWTNNSGVQISLSVSYAFITPQ